MTKHDNGGEMADDIENIFCHMCGKEQTPTCLFCADYLNKMNYERGFTAGLNRAVEIAKRFVEEPDPYDHGSCAGKGWDDCADAIHKAIEREWDYFFSRLVQGVIP